MKETEVPVSVRQKLVFHKDKKIKEEAKEHLALFGNKICACCGGIGICELDNHIPKDSAYWEMKRIAFKEMGWGKKYVGYDGRYHS